MQETWVPSLSREDPLEKEMATHSSTLAWKITWTEEHSGLQSMGSQRVGHDWATSLSFPFLGIIRVRLIESERGLWPCACNSPKCWVTCGRESSDDYPQCKQSIWPCLTSKQVSKHSREICSQTITILSIGPMFLSPVVLVPARGTTFHKYLNEIMAWLPYKIVSSPAYKVFKQ